MDKLSEEVKYSTAVTPTAGVAGTTTINGSTLDMAGFNNLQVHIRMGTITAGAATSLKLQHGDASNLSDAADVAGSNQTILDTDDDSIFVMDVDLPTKRYVRVVVLRATQNAVVASGVYHQYRAQTVPITQPAGTTVLKLSAPISGTP
jgi:hypothetical protein